MNPTIIPVDGQLVLEKRIRFKECVLDQLEQGAKAIVLDFSNSGYVDSSGIGVLVTLARYCRDRARVPFILAGLDDDTRSLFEITKIAALFRIAPSVDAAVAELAREAAA